MLYHLKTLTKQLDTIIRIKSFADFASQQSKDITANTLHRVPGTFDWQLQSHLGITQMESQTNRRAKLKAHEKVLIKLHSDA